MANLLWINGNADGRADGVIASGNDIEQGNATQVVHGAFTSDDPAPRLTNAEQL